MDVLPSTLGSLRLGGPTATAIAPTWGFSALDEEESASLASLTPPSRSPPEDKTTSPPPTSPPISDETPVSPPVKHVVYPPASLLGLSDELLAIILSYCMVHPGFPASSPVFSYPAGVIPSDVHASLRLLLHPLRCHPRLFAIAKQEYLRSNLFILNVQDVRASTIALIPPSGVTKHPVATLLERLVHIQLHVSVSDLRAPFTQRFSAQFVDILNMDRESAELRLLPTYCPNLKSVHLFLKVDEWYLVPGGPDVRRESGRAKKMTEREVRYRGRAETVVELARTLLPYRSVSVAFHHWRGDMQLVDGRDMSTRDVVEGILGATPEETWVAPVVRLR